MEGENLFLNIYKKLKTNYSHNIAIRELLAKHWLEVARIYAEGIATRNATFQNEVPEWTIWDRDHRKDCRLIAQDGQDILGWAALSSVSSRCVYAGVAEVSIYVAVAHQGKGVGNLLMQALIESSEKHHIWTLQAGIFPENTGSIRLHQKYGFREIGRRERLGKMDGIWRDVSLYERRSKVIGID